MDGAAPRSTRTATIQQEGTCEHQGDGGLHSQYGNTRTVADAIAHAIAADLRESDGVQVLGIEELSPVDLQDADLVIAGAPTHMTNLPVAVSDALDALPKDTLTGKACAVFDTSYEMSRWLQPFTASRRLAKRLKKLGGKMIIAPECFLIERHHEGPLQAGELEQAGKWAHNLLEKMEGECALD